MSTTLYRRLRELLPEAPVLTATVTTVYAGGMALVAHPGGAQQNVRNPFDHVAGATVYVQNGAITGDAPELPYVFIEI